MDVRQRLIEGIRRFRTEVYPERRDAYIKAESEPQRPQASTSADGSSGAPTSASRGFPSA